MVKTLFLQYFYKTQTLFILDSQNNGKQNKYRFIFSINGIFQPETVRVGNVKTACQIQNKGLFTTHKHLY